VCVWRAKSESLLNVLTLTEALISGLYAAVIPITSPSRVTKFKTQNKLNAMIVQFLT